VNKMNVIARVPEQNGLPHAKAAEVVDATFAAIEAALRASKRFA